MTEVAQRDQQYAAAQDAVVRAALHLAAVASGATRVGGARPTEAGRLALQALADGLTPGEIAAARGNTVNSVYNLIQRTCRIIDAASKEHAVAIGIREGWLR